MPRVVRQTVMVTLSSPKNSGGAGRGRTSVVVIQPNPGDPSRIRRVLIQVRYNASPGAPKSSFGLHMGFH